MLLAQQEKQQIKGYKFQICSGAWVWCMSLRCKQWKDWSSKYQEPVTKLSGFKSCPPVIISVLVAEGTSRKLWLPSLGGSNLGHMRCHCCYRWQPCHQRCLPSSGGWYGLWWSLLLAGSFCLSEGCLLIDWVIPGLQGYSGVGACGESGPGHCKKSS